MSLDSTRPVAQTRATVVVGVVGLLVGVAVGVAGSALLPVRSSAPEVARAVIDSVEAGTGLVCLRRSEGDLVDCYPSSVQGLSAGATIDYALSTAAVDPRQDGGGTQQVIIWAVQTPQ